MIDCGTITWIEERSHIQLYHITQIYIRTIDSMVVIDTISTIVPHLLAELDAVSECKLFTRIL